jgi:prefoldin subunit 5
VDNGIKEELIRQIASLRQEIGELRGKVESMAQDVAEIRTKVDTLNSFRWKIYGATAAISFVAGLIGAIIAIVSYLR